MNKKKTLTQGFEKLRGRIYDKSQRIIKPKKFYLNHTKYFRFNRRKEDIEKQLETSKLDSPLISVARSTALTNENNDFDVETYEPEYEETDQSVHPPSLIVKPRKPFHLPLTDVLYPGEKSSEFDLKRYGPSYTFFFRSFGNIFNHDTYIVVISSLRITKNRDKM